MTLQEAIKHAEEIAKENQAIVDNFDYYGESMAKCEKCAREHRQLAGWLSALAHFKEVAGEVLADLEAAGDMAVKCDDEYRNGFFKAYYIVDDFLGEVAEIRDYSEVV